MTYEFYSQIEAWAFAKRKEAQGFVVAVDWVEEDTYRVTVYRLVAA